MVVHSETKVLKTRTRLCERYCGVEEADFLQAQTIIDSAAGNGNAGAENADLAFVKD